MTFSSTGSGNSSLQVGFLEFTPSGSKLVASGDGGPALFMRQNGSGWARSDGAVSNGSSFEFNSGSYTGRNTNIFRIVLDTSATAWTIKAYLNGGLIGSEFTYSTNPTI